MRRKLMLFSLCGLIAAPPATMASPSNAVVNAVLASTYRVEATACSTPGKTYRIGTAVAVSVDGTTHIVTALHVVAGCKKIAIYDQGGNHSRVTADAHILISADLAELTPPKDWKAPTSPPAIGTANRGDDVTSLGYGETDTVMSRKLAVRQVGPPTLAKLTASLGAPNHQTSTTYPSLSEAILDLEKQSLLPGDSGGPLIDDVGRVVGIGNGGLFSGSVNISWGFPAGRIRDLITSTDQLKSEVALTGLMSAEVDEDPAKSGSASPAALLTTDKIQCGGAKLIRVAKRSLADITASADPLEKAQVAFVTQVAQAYGKSVPPTTQFDVYVDPQTGGTVSIPTALGQPATQGASQPCVWTPADVELRILIKQTSLAAINADSLAFEQLSLKPGEVTLQLPQVSMPMPAQRIDGMIVRRGGMAVGKPVLTPMGPTLVPPVNEQYVVHAMRNNWYVGASVISTTPAPATRSNEWYPALMTVQLATFAFTGSAAIATWATTP